MAIDFQQIYARIREIGAGARERQKTLDDRRASARRLLADYANQTEVLRLKVDSAKAADPNIRCAYPLDERLDSHYPAPAPTEGATLIAADGSQINPDRHAAVLYSLINIGVIILKPGSGNAPEIATYSDLKYGDDLYTDHGLLTEDMVALGRDLSERKKLLELALQHSSPVLTLTDGPIELWGAEGSSQEDYRRNREIHLSILAKLRSENIITAGYIDKPAADLVVRLLEIGQVRNGEMQSIRKIHSLRGVSDRWLFGQEGQPLLGRGERSAIFIIQSSSRSHYKDDLEIRFFYLNVGTEKHPWIVRVEIPAWVAEDKGKVDLLHASLLSQCEIMGVRPYPYILHRAHESAVVRQDERQQIEQMLMQELLRQAVGEDEGSYKQSAKGLKGRTSYKT